ncbi:MAG: 2-amino-4-hydroxy-6-hydroxymethyldihydropteridine diphosphokinase, partial [Planctomycetes bacterium]|nr:2-amino-4-hydroxy-6-hydroxymethyldihydropteridine diphosphokinase [Planctomycetota bacterium]
MATSLLGLGSNLGEREVTLCAALDAIDALAGVRLVRQSRLYATQPIGGSAGQDEYLNAAALVKTDLEPLAMLRKLQGIEDRFGRERGERWAARTLDIDLLLYGDLVIDSAEMSVPHPRMSFRPFVLEPAAEIAGAMIHPAIGWTIGQLREHLDSASDRVAILSSSATANRDVAELLARRVNARIMAVPDIPAIARLWPAGRATWLELAEVRGAVDKAVAAEIPDVSAQYPKLTIIIRGDQPAVWANVPGRGPTLVLKAADQRAIEREVLAAVQAVWPGLGPW